MNIMAILNNTINLAHQLLTGSRMKVKHCNFFQIGFKEFRICLGGVFIYFFWTEFISFLFCNNHTLNKSKPHNESGRTQKTLAVFGVSFFQREYLEELVHFFSIFDFFWQFLAGDFCSLDDLTFSSHKHLSDENNLSKNKKLEAFKLYFLCNFGYFSNQISPLKLRRFKLDFKNLLLFRELLRKTKK